MTPKQKADANRKIAQMMGWTCINGNLGIPPKKKYDNSSLYPLPSPHESWADCMEAVEKTCKSDTVPFQYALTIVKLNDGTYRATIETYTHPSGYKAHVGKAETRKAAVCTALLEYGEGRP